MWNVKCNVSKVVVDFEKRYGLMYLPADNCPDMSSTIRHFTNIDDEVDTIYTYIDGFPDVIYTIIDGKWEAQYPPEPVRNRRHAIHQESPSL